MNQLSHISLAQFALVERVIDRDGKIHLSVLVCGVRQIEISEDVARTGSDCETSGQRVSSCFF